jgi:biofilm PGA synthesis N-glycosyltransferase PgaC
MSEPLGYVLITPARDGAANIGKTIAAVRAQVVPPTRWVIVDDGSSDSTAEIVHEHSTGANWITLIRRPGGTVADFVSKVNAFCAGLASLDGMDYAFIGNLDADVSFEPDYFQRVLRAFADRPRLGIAGGHVVEEFRGRRVPQRISPNSVAGAVQLFRRQTFTDIGGIRPLRLGGEDSVAEILARMHGWDVATLFDLKVRHHGRVLAGHRRPWTAWFTRGMVYRTLRYDPLFQVAMSGYRAVAQPPYVISGTAMLAGYVRAAAGRIAPAMDADAVAYLRREQRQRLLGLLRRGLGAG